MKTFLTPALVAVSLLFTGCASTTEGGAVGASRSQLLLVSSAELDQMAAQSYAKLKAEASAKGTLNTNAAMLARVRAVAARIEPQTAVFRADAPRWQWEVNLITSDHDANDKPFLTQFPYLAEPWPWRPQPFVGSPWTWFRAHLLWPLVAIITALLALSLYRRRLCARLRAARA